ncbi:unnamed protein product [Hermetia illucens]|uniref:Peptidase S1 domain-containing protein n=1 Tax=Hermetia illucens TaxID=343691 RepID=A0A7R8Z185_HERIL|nr:brachyurin-like [Hermetia illucens]CAD7091653.1 unnamed protein product [Hermetia illucens]
MSFLVIFSAILYAVSAAELPPVAVVKDIQEDFVKSPLSRITGGNEADPHSIPYQVALQLRSGSGSSAFCGGSLISDKFVVTAAHCVDGMTSATIFLGAHHLRVPETDRIQQSVNKSNFIIHEQWNSRQIRNDVALIKLAFPIQFNDNISAVNLPRRKDVTKSYVSEMATASGWGVFSDKKPSVSPVLRYINATVINQNQCRRSLGSTVQSTNICISGANGASTCSGDSGGPLVIYEADGSRTLVGITSFGSARGCEMNYAAAFVRVTSYLNWITSNAGIELR